MDSSCLFQFVTVNFTVFGHRHCFQLEHFIRTHKRRQNRLQSFLKFFLILTSGIEQQDSLFHTVVYAASPGNVIDSLNLRFNFTKFLVNREGQVVARFEPTVSMEDVRAAVLAEVGE